MHLPLTASRMVPTTCEIFFHIPKTGGQSLHNLIYRQYRGKTILNTHLGLLTTPVWQRFAQGLAVDSAQPQPRYDVITGHMRFGLHDRLSGPSRYITFLREPVKRFVSYYLMLTRMGIVPQGHQIDPGQPDWNLGAHETLARELDNGQTRLLANADWNLPIGHCTEEHFKIAQANLDRYFAFVGVTEHFDLSLMFVQKICGWRWRFYVPRNVAPAHHQPRVSPQVIEAISHLNRFDRELHAQATARLMQLARSRGLPLRLEHLAYRACNAVHLKRHTLRVSLRRKTKMSR